MRAEDRCGVKSVKRGKREAAKLFAAQSERLGKLQGTLDPSVLHEGRSGAVRGSEQFDGQECKVDSCRSEHERGKSKSAASLIRARQRARQRAREKAKIQPQIPAFRNIFEHAEQLKITPLIGDWEPVNFDHCPTGYPPGSVEKIQVMRKRLENGQPLWHDGDVKTYMKIDAKIMEPWARAREVSEVIKESRCS